MLCASSSSSLFIKGHSASGSCAALRQDDRLRASYVSQTIATPRPARARCPAACREPSCLSRIRMRSTNRARPIENRNVLPVRSKREKRMRCRGDHDEKENPKQSARESEIGGAARQRQERRSARAGDEGRHRNDACWSFSETGHRPICSCVRRAGNNRLPIVHPNIRFFLFSVPRCASEEPPSNKRLQLVFRIVADGRSAYSEDGTVR